MGTEPKRNFVLKTQKMFPLHLVAPLTFIWLFGCSFYIHLVVPLTFACSVYIYIKSTFFALKATVMVVCSLPMKTKEKLACGVLATFATHTGLVYDVTDTDRHKMAAPTVVFL